MAFSGRVLSVLLHELLNDVDFIVDMTRIKKRKTMRAAPNIMEIEYDIYKCMF